MNALLLCGLCGYYTINRETEPLFPLPQVGEGIFKVKNMTLYPWQKKQWHHMVQLRAHQRLPHALLLNGTKDLGKRTFALALARYVLCLKNETEPCGTCQGCLLLQAGSHPDFYLVEPQEKSKVIKIEQIRELVDSLTQTAQQGGWQVVVIHPAEAMNVASANALLKTLEEPHPQVMFLLVTHQLSRVPATIRSRCQRVDFSIPESLDALAWLSNQTLASDHSPEMLLRLAEGIPLKAVMLSQNNYLAIYQKIAVCFLKIRLSQLNPLEGAQHLLEIAPEHIFNVLWSLVMDMVHLRLKSPEKSVVNADYLPQLQSVSAHLTLVHLFAFLDELMAYKRKNESSISVNQQLLWESLLIRWWGLQ